MNNYEDFYKKDVEIINNKNLAAYEVRIELLNLVDKTKNRFNIINKEEEQ